MTYTRDMNMIIKDNDIDEYDGTPANWEDEYDSISLTVVPELAVWKSYYRCPLAPLPIQLAAKSSDFTTMKEVGDFYKQKYEKEFEDAKMMKEVEKEDKALEALKIEKEKNKEFEDLPTESEAFKQRREAAEKALREEAEVFRKKTIAEQQQGNVWGHRRNGGGKKKRRTCKETSAETIQARRFLHRRNVKNQKKVDEGIRAANFAALALAENNVTQVKQPVELDDDEVEMRKLLLTKLENMPLPQIPIHSPPPSSPPSSPPVPLVCKEVEEGWEVVKRKDVVKPENRDSGVEILSDQSKMRQHLKRTKMCLSVKSGKPCPHGVNCRFAHSVDELSISDCFFGSKCKFVCCKGGVFINTSSKPCQHRHPEESEYNYFRRTGIPDFRPKKTTQPETPKLNNDNFPALSKSLQLPPPTKWVKPPTITRSVTKPVSPPPPEPEEETVIKVPKELALQAMELAIASGKKLIRIEIE